MNNLFIDFDNRRVYTLDNDNHLLVCYFPEGENLFTNEHWETVTIVTCPITDSQLRASEYDTIFNSLYNSI